MDSGKQKRAAILTKRVKLWPFRSALPPGSDADGR
jgi:hypothetical protein